MVPFSLLYSPQFKSLLKRGAPSQLDLYLVLFKAGGVEIKGDKISSQPVPLDSKALAAAIGDQPDR